MSREILAAMLLLAGFAFAMGYLLGRTDEQEIRPRRHPKDLDSLTVVNLHRQAARKAAPRRRG